MVAYSFKERFAPPILSGEKLQTIRAHRKRHARPGEELQLYTGMRTLQCRLIGHALCSTVQPIRIDVAGGAIHFPWLVETITSETELDAFARRDGFESWEDMQRFWQQEHPSIAVFDGVLIGWAQLLAQPA